MNRTIGKGLVAVAALLLAGCTGNFYDSRMRGYMPEYPEQRYPIEVVKGAAQLRIPLVAGRLTAEERIQVQRFAQQAYSLPGPIQVIRPEGSVKGEVLAAEVTKELIRSGIAAERIVHRQGKVDGVLVYMRRKIAVTRECGDWSKPLNETAMNRLYPNFGCAQQHNLAAMVDNPEDFERPRVMTPPDSDARNAAMQKYRRQEDYTSTWPGGSRIRIDESVAAQAGN